MTTNPQGRRTEQILIVVKTYPTPSAKSIEASCTAGITKAGQFLRLYPIPFRFLDDTQKFRKYQEIEASIWPASDGRPESHKIDPDSIRILGDPLPTVSHWAERRSRISHLEKHCMCCIQNEQRANGAPTLGFFKPYEILGLVIEDTSEKWMTEELEKLRQRSFWTPQDIVDLEKIPYRFKYHFRCDHAECNGHKQSCTDWELSQSYRRWRATYGGDWQEKFVQRYETEMIERFDTHFYAGTVHQHPNSWILVGLWYPLKRNEGQPENRQGTLL